MLSIILYNFGKLNDWFVLTYLSKDLQEKKLS